MLTKQELSENVVAAQRNHGDALATDWDLD
jgi:hypothetical protein